MATKKNKKTGQQDFNDTYSKKDEINFVAGKKDLKGYLKIEDYTKLKSVSLKKVKLSGLEIINCYKLTKVDLSQLSKLKRLSISDCPELAELDCSRIKSLNELEVKNLTKLNCSSTSIKELSLNLCPNIINLNCSNNEKLINLDISNCSKLEVLDCSKTKLTNLNLSNCPKNIKVNHPSNLEIAWEKENRKNLLVVGMTGSGKSTLANVLTETEVFKESAYGVSETKHFKKQEFDWGGEKYRLVDTMGVGDTKLLTKDVLYKIAEGIYSMPEGISQVLFVVDGRFTKETIKAFNMFKDYIFKTGILNYVTIVRTKFHNFRDNDECEIDKRKMIEENEAIKFIIESCKGVVHVDNPPEVIIQNEEDKTINTLYKGMRRKSRTKLREHLEIVCKNGYFQLEGWSDLHNKIIKYANESDLNNIDKGLSDIVEISKSCIFL